MYYSAATHGFYDGSEKNVPTDTVEISDIEWHELLNGQSTGKTIISGDNNLPVLMEPLRGDVANAKKIMLANAARNFININQWPSRLALGRLNTDELNAFNIWIDYLDALEAIDISSTEDIIWPDAPSA